MKFDYIVTEPRKELNFPLARAEAIALAEIYLEFHLYREIFHCMFQTDDTSSAYHEHRAMDRLGALIESGLVTLGEMDHLAELILGQDDCGPRRRERHWRPSPTAGLMGVRARLTGDGVPGLELKCL